MAAWSELGAIAMHDADDNDGWVRSNVSKIDQLSLPKSDDD